MSVENSDASGHAQNELKPCVVILLFHTSVRFSKVHSQINIKICNYDCIAFMP